MIQNTASGADDAFAADLLRGHTDTIVLGVLRRQDSYGFEIYKTIRDATGGSYEIKEATLYATYRRLLKDGLAEAYWGDESQGGRRKYYRITDAGRAVYRQNLHRLGRHPRHHRLPPRPGRRRSPSEAQAPTTERHPS